MPAVCTVREGERGIIRRFRSDDSSEYDVVQPAIRRTSFEGRKTRECIARIRLITREKLRIVLRKSDGLGLDGGHGELWQAVPDENQERASVKSTKVKFVLYRNPL